MADREAGREGDSVRLSFYSLPVVPVTVVERNYHCPSVEQSFSSSGCLAGWLPGLPARSPATASIKAFPFSRRSFAVM